MSPHCQGRRMFGVVRGIQLVPLQKALLDQLKQIIIIIAIIYYHDYHYYCYSILLTVLAGISNKKQPPLKGRSCPSDYQNPLACLGFVLLCSSVWVSSSFYLLLVLLVL